MLKSVLSKSGSSRPGRRILRAGLALLFALGLVSPGTARGDPPGETNCRFGLVFQGDLNGHQADYQMDQLNVGSYLDGKPDTWPDLPPGSEYIPVLALRDLPDPPEPVAGWVHDHPGATWLIGDEPDNPIRDNLTAEAYAARYYELATLIRGLDPGARLGFGAIAQPSPIRRRYLTRAWEELIRLAGGKEAASGLVDIWNIHAFYLGEVKDDPTGAGIPPGFEDDAEDAYGKAEKILSTDPTLFVKRIKEIRQLLTKLGERTKSLWIGSYGVNLPPPDISDLSTSRFMLQTFNFLKNDEDSNAGSQNNNDHLVQRWFWYSMNGKRNIHGGSLFDPDDIYPSNQTEIGTQFFDYVRLIPLIDNFLVPEIYLKTLNYDANSFTVDETINVVITNDGNHSNGGITTISVWDGDPQIDGKLIGSADLPHPLPGCGASDTMTFPWSGVIPYQSHALYIGIGPQVDNNLTRFDVVPGPPRIFFPLIIREASDSP
jgi:hypothetical protein